MELDREGDAEGTGTKDVLSPLSEVDRDKTAQVLNETNTAHEEISKYPNHPMEEPCMVTERWNGQHHLGQQRKEQHIIEPDVTKRVGLAIETIEGEGEVALFRSPEQLERLIRAGGGRSMSGQDWGDDLIPKESSSVKEDESTVCMKLVPAHQVGLDAIARSETLDGDQEGGAIERERDRNWAMGTLDDVGTDSDRLSWSDEDTQKLRKANISSSLSASQGEEDNIVPTKGTVSLSYRPYEFWLILFFYSRRELGF